MDFSKLLGGANPLDMIKQLSGDQLHQAMSGSVDKLDDNSRASLGQHVLDAFTNHQGFSGTGADAAQQAGTTEEAVQSGSPGALQSILDYAKGHPEIMQTASTAFMTKNPGILASLGPSLLGGLFNKH